VSILKYILVIVKFNFVLKSFRYDLVKGSKVSPRVFPSPLPDYSLTPILASQIKMSYSFSLPSEVEPKLGQLQDSPPS